MHKKAKLLGRWEGQLKTIMSTSSWLNFKVRWWSSYFGRCVRKKMRSCSVKQSFVPGADQATSQSRRHEKKGSLLWWIYNSLRHRLRNENILTGTVMQMRRSLIRGNGTHAHERKMFWQVPFQQPQFDGDEVGINTFGCPGLQNSSRTCPLAPKNDRTNVQKY